MMSFKGTGICSDNCEKELASINGTDTKARRYNELNPHPTQLTELEKELITFIGFLTGSGGSSSNVMDFPRSHINAFRSMGIKTTIEFVDGSIRVMKTA